MAEILEPTFLFYGKDTATLKDFPLQKEFHALLTNGAAVYLMVLYNPETGRKKFFISDYLSGDDMIKAWNHRWSIETLHNDVKDLGIGEYQVRRREGSLIQARTSFAAYTLLSIMMRESQKLFGKFLKTIGECSRSIKEFLILKKNYKYKLFSG